MRGVTNGNADNVLHNPISTHTPHARRDVDVHHARQRNFEFLLTRLMRGVTGNICLYS